MVKRQFDSVPRKRKPSTQWLGPADLCGLNTLTIHFTLLYVMTILLLSSLYALLLNCPSSGCSQ